MRPPTAGLSVAAGPLDDAPLTREHLRVVLIGAAGWFCDVIELGVGSVLAAVYSVNTSPISAGQLSWLLGATYVGAIVGAPTLGWVADRYGRRRTLLVTLTTLAVSSCAAAITPNVWWLIICRMTSGLAIGAYPVIIAAYFSELMPLRARGKMLLIAAGMGSVAWPATLFGARLLVASPVGAEAWRWICAGGGAGAALTAIAALRLHESPRWLRSKQKCASAERVEQAFLSATPVFARQPSLSSSSHAACGATSTALTETRSARSVRPSLVVALAALLNGLSPWSTVGFPLLSGAVLIARGFRLTDTLMFTGLGACGSVAGLLAVSWRIDRLERRTVLLLCALLMAASEVVFALATKPFWLVAAGVLLTAAAAIYLHMLNLYVAEMFRTQNRALAVSIGWAVNRSISVILPLILLPLLVLKGAIWMCGAQAGTLIISAVFLAIAPKGRAGRPIV